MDWCYKFYFFFTSIVRFSTVVNVDEISIFLECVFLPVTLR